MEKRLKKLNKKEKTANSINNYTNDKERWITVEYGKPIEKEAQQTIKR